MPGVEEALRILRRHNDDTEEPTVQSMERSEEVHYQKLRERQRLEEEQKCPSLKSIPRFFERKAPVQEMSSLREDVLKLARTHLLHRKSREEILDEEDLHTMLALLKEHARERGPTDKSSDIEVIDYAGFVRIREELVKRGERFRNFFLPSMFLKFPRDENGCIAILHLLNFVVRKVNMKQQRFELSYYDEKRRGYLREKDMENFIFELIPRLPQLNSLQEEFYPFYVFTAVRKFFFFLRSEEDRPNFHSRAALVAHPARALRAAAGATARGIGGRAKLVQHAVGAESLWSLPGVGRGPKRDAEQKRVEPLRQRHAHRRFHRPRFRRDPDIQGRRDRRARDGLQGVLGFCPRNGEQEHEAGDTAFLEADRYQPQR
mmetsp:Transcript_8549/g.22060  ORF Transcript_8549/g.22060 Transcript_8549/m.22060 type:complete len:375 (-) Transcript_8549:417-1541(-)